MRFWSKVEVADAAADLGAAGPDRPAVAAVASCLRTPDAAEDARACRWPPVSSAGPTRASTCSWPAADLPRSAAALIAAGAVPAGSWAADALRIPTRRPRWGVDTDERTIPNEVPWLRTAVHLEKGCYRGQETVARVHNLGRPPRRLVMLNLDGSADHLPRPATR